MIKADYDSQGDTIQIELEPVKQAGYGEDVENGAVVVSVLDDRPVMLDVIGTRNHRLREAASDGGRDV